MTKIKLRKIAHARSGDKGDTLSIALIPYNDEDYELLKEQVTQEKVNKHFTNIVKPLNASLDYFVEKMKDNALTLPFSYDVTNRIKVGIYTSNKGNTEQIFSDPLDGVEFVSTVTLNKSNVCEC